jgi:hypothetical protein
MTYVSRSEYEFGDPPSPERSSRMTKDGATVLEPDPLEVTTHHAVESITRGEIDVQIATAKRFPRSLKTFKDRALEMATLDQETAESCIYALPRDGKTIEGPSARLAELLASAWRNLRIEGRVVDDDGRFVTARGTAFDIEANVLIAYETKRRVTSKNGKRYSDDMITVTSNAATSIAIRNAILKVVPKAFWGPVYDACRQVAVGDASTLVGRRDKMLAYFLKMGVHNEKVFRLLDIKGAEDISLEHLATLKGLATAIKEGDTSVDEAFAGPTRDPKPTDKPKPEAFDEWLIDMTAAADEGTALLAEAWVKAPRVVRDYLAATEPGAWDGLKKRAVEADAKKNTAAKDE